MTDVDAGATVPPDSVQPAPESPQLRILAQFIRDLSFENPRAPDVLRAAGQPNVEMGVEMSARGRSDGLFEVDLKLSAKASREAEVAFQVELVYGGLFEMQGVPGEQLEYALLTECPRFLFPFARQIIADLTSGGGFPPFLLEPIDFAQVYATQQIQRENGAQLNNPPVGNA
jgi:preprotein translocase subunit SecB